MNISAFWRCLEGGIPPVTFLLILWLLAESQASRLTHTLVVLGFAAAEVTVQLSVLLRWDSPELVLTLLPLTCSLPAIVCLHVLSRRRFLPTALTWLLALLCEHLLLSLRKLLVVLHPDWLCAAVLLTAAGILLGLVVRLRQTDVLSDLETLDSGWSYLLFLPVMLLALYSYFLSSTTDRVALLLLFFTALAALLVLARLIGSLAEEQRSQTSQLQIQTLRKDYAALQNKLNLDRRYRHDMHHHMVALSAILQRGNCGEAQQYIAALQNQLAQIETEVFCRNTAVNGVLSAYLSRARDLGCILDVDVSLPETVPFSEADLCVVLANALENAVHACEKQPDGKPRRIRLSAALLGQRLTICVENSCWESVAFDEQGFPIVPHSEGHGQGLRSIAAVAEKYHGLFQCGYKDNHFTLWVILLDAVPKVRRRTAAAVRAGGILLISLFLLNCMPAAADALESLPVLGQMVRIVDLRSYALGWGDTGITIQDPVLDGGDGADDLTAQKNDFLAQMQKQFLGYAARKYQGYAAEDITYDVIRDDEQLYILRFDAVLNAGGSVEVRRHVTLDRASGQVLELADLFASDVNYTFPISREIEAQMSEQNGAGEGQYFLPGGIWPDEDCFQSIDPDQDFYINANGQLVIVFEEYEVAPGSMGVPEFVIPTEVLDGLLEQPTVLR